MTRLRAQNLHVGYSGRSVVAGLSLEVPDRLMTAVVGPNACGKSTLLRALARLLAPSAGQVILDGRDIRGRPTKEVARLLGLLPQTGTAPEGITVADLVSRGRFPHQRLLRQWTGANDIAVTEAMERTGIAELSDRIVDELSGGQRQRVWVAMVLAQQTPLILLDEPTTYLDIAHQVELLDLFAELNRDEGRTVVAVLHDLNHACRYADQIVVMKDGAVVAVGPPAEVVTAALVEHVYGMVCQIIDDPQTQTPLVVPQASPVLLRRRADRP